MPKPEHQILVCVNDRGAEAQKASCGQGAGLELYRCLKDAVRARALKHRLLITRTGCLHHCSRGVTVAVWPANRWYGGVVAEDADRLLDAVLAGSDLADRLMPPGDWE